MRYGMDYKYVRLQLPPWVVFSRISKMGRQPTMEMGSNTDSGMNGTGYLQGERCYFVQYGVHQAGQFDSADITVQQLSDRADEGASVSYSPLPWSIDCRMYRVMPRIWLTTKTSFKAWADPELGDTRWLLVITSGGSFLVLIRGS